ncbi:MAG: hypothetical protein U0X75_20990 [Acidobacteriota bacterium]
MDWPTRQFRSAREFYGTVDTYCALIADRPHRNHYAPADAEQLVADLAGIEFDPQVVKCLLAILAEERQHHAPELWQVPPAFGSVASVTPEETDVETVPLAPVTNELPFLTESVAESFSASPARVEEFSESEAVAAEVATTALMPESAPDTTYDVAPEPAEQMPALEVVEADFRSLRNLRRNGTASGKRARTNGGGGNIGRAGGCQ